jgi:endophilin-B
MDFNLKKLANDASGLYNRAKQLTEEKLLHAERTELDPHFEQLLYKADRAEDQTRKLLSAIEAYLQPNPGIKKFVKI